MRVTPDCDTVNSFPICNLADSQFGPDIVFTGENYLTVWSDRRFTGTHWWITAARVTRDGVVLDTGHVVGDRGNTSEYYPSIAFDGARSLVVWYHSLHQPWGIYGRFLDAAARGEDSVFTIARTRTHFYNRPRIAFGDSAYFVTWADFREGAEDFDVRGRLVAPDGRLLGEERLIATGPADQRRPHVSWDGREYLVVWSEGGVIVGRRVGSDGVPLGAAFAVSDTTGNDRRHPAAFAGRGGRLVVWTERRGVETDIYGRLVPAPGVAEAGPGSGRKPVPGATILPGHRLVREGLELYDRSGRAVTGSQLEPGVYFVIDTDRTVRRLVLLK